MWQYYLLTVVVMEQKRCLQSLVNKKKIDYQLEIEAATALSQSEIKLISRNVANDIAKNARSGKINS